MKLGTDYGGWHIPIKNMLNKESIVYSGGVGEDISFDIKLQSKYDCNIYLIDPTVKSVKHFEECKNYFCDRTFKFTGGIQKDYYDTIKNETPNMDKISYIETGLWDKKTELKFYKQSNENYVSQSLISNMFTSNYDIVNVDSIRNIMNKLGHTTIDLLKLDIEGAEIVVLEKMLDDKIYPKYLCIEFDLLRNNKDTNGCTEKLINRLINEGYRILINDKLNITFEYI